MSSLLLLGCVVLASVLSESPVIGQDDQPAAAPGGATFGSVIEPPDADLTGLISTGFGVIIELHDATGTAIGELSSVGGRQLPAGSYTARLTGLERLPRGWDFAVACDDADSDSPSGLVAGTIDVSLGIEPGEFVGCVLTFFSPGPAAAPGGREASASEEPDPPSDTPVPSGPIPQEGRWRVTEVDNSIECPFPITLDKGRRMVGTLRVQRGGQRIVASGFMEGRRGKIKLDLERAGHYLGSTTQRQAGVPARVTLVWRVLSSTSMSGVTTATVKVRGSTCSVSRMFEMERIGS